MSVRLTEKRLDIILSALAFYEDYLDDGEGVCWETQAEYRLLKHDRDQAFIWAHQELAKRKARRTE